MTINVHPALVHFPVALITLYGLLMTFTPPLWRRKQAWFPLVSFLIITGALGAIVGYLTGSLIEPDFRGPAMNGLLEAHEGWASTTVWLSVILAVVHVLELWGHRSQDVPLSRIQPGIRVWIQRITHALTHGPISVFSGLVFLVVITITGALGGAIAQGKTVDPVVSLVVRLLGL